MKIVVTGAKGQVGNEVVDLCIKQNISFVPFISTTDITQLDSLKQELSKIEKIDILINCAAYTAVDKAEDEPCKAYNVNKLGVANLALLCKERNISFLHISTDYVFSGEEKFPYNEEQKPNPVGIYGKSKWEGEKELQRIWNKHVILRVSWVYGKYGNNFVKTILRLASERETLSVVGDQRGCPTSAKNIAFVLIQIAKQIYSGNPYWGVYHYCGSPATNWHHFSTEIINNAKDSSHFRIKEIKNISTEDYPTKAKRPRNSELCVEKIMRDYSIEREDWRSSLQDIIVEMGEENV